MYSKQLLVQNQRSTHVNPPRYRLLESFAFILYACVSNGKIIVIATDRQTTKC